MRDNLICGHCYKRKLGEPCTSWGRIAEKTSF
ncbi:hypothetical protein POUND7_018536 [Theobroma cacao]